MELCSFDGCMLFYLTIVPLLWFLGIPLVLNLIWYVRKTINFLYVAYLVLAICFTVLYFQGEEWTFVMWAPTTLILAVMVKSVGIPDYLTRKFGQEESYKKSSRQSRWRKEKSYKKEKKQSRWKSWKKANEEDRIYEEAKKKWEEDNKKRSNSDYESKRERTWPKDESQDFGREDKKDESQDFGREDKKDESQDFGRENKKDNEAWKDVYKKKNIENMTRDELRYAFTVGAYHEWKTATDEEKKWIEEVKDELSKRKRNRSFTNPNY